jgi:quinohemoprotein ethanol dehydrogenase
MQHMKPIQVLCLVAIGLLASCGGEKQTAEQGTTPPTVSTEPAAPSKFGEIDRDRLLNADADPGDWLTTGRNFGRTHYSALNQINKDTVHRLGFAWQYETFTNRGLEATPIVVDGVMYTSGVAGRVYALNARTGEEIWNFNPEIDRQVDRGSCCDEVNRGVAVWKGKVYVAAFDGRLFALDARSGSVIWQADTIIDHTRGYSSTGAPEVAGNVVVIGNGGAEYDARGYVSAYDVETGEFKWRFFIVPGDPKKGFEHPELEMAAKTWDPNSRWDVGLGGTPWGALVYDPELNLLYVGTGNAALYSYHDRSPSGGDNLFLTSILAIDPDTGRMKWYYQEVPGDRWDYTAVQPIMLADLMIGGKLRKVLMQAPKNGYFYVLDRETGEFISAKNIVPVNWGSVDPETGKPTVDLEAADYTNGPKYVTPGSMGAHSWQAMALSRDTGLVYIPVIRSGMVIFDATKGHKYRPGLGNTGVVNLMGGTVNLSTATYPPEIEKILKSGELFKNYPDREMRTYLIAWDPVRQKQVWQTPDAEWWDRAGVLATAGRLLFVGNGAGQFRALDDATGDVVKAIETGSTIMAAPMTYTVDGEQYIAVMAAFGGGGWYFPHENSAAYKYGNMGRILTFKLDGGEAPIPPLLPTDDPIPQPPKQTASKKTIEKGQELFGANCRACHSNQTRTLSADLRRMSPETQSRFNDIVLHGTLRTGGMPQWDDVLSEKDADAIHAYLIQLAQNAYDEEQAAANAVK